MIFWRLTPNAKTPKKVFAVSYRTPAPVQVTDIANAIGFLTCGAVKVSVAAGTQAAQLSSFNLAC